MDQAVPRALRTASRVLKLFGFTFSWSPLVMGGIPHSSVSGKDVHSDREACRVFNPFYLSSANQWDSYAPRLLQFTINLFFSSWTASRAYTLDQLISNTFCSYYLLLALTWDAHRNHGNKWAWHWLPKRTVKNMLCLVFFDLHFGKVCVLLYFLLFSSGRSSPPGPMCK